MTSFTGKIRVRIAPSPTGFMHIGNLRTILYNYLFARHHDGTFVVRIEDTDRTRFVPGAMEDMLQTLTWAGLDYDEGPFVENNKIIEKGEFGPYIQSERLDIYQKHIKTLIDKNRAYYCFCDKDRLEKLRAEQVEQKLPPKYDGHCQDLTKEEIQEKLNNKQPFVIRFRMPENREVLFDDAIRGTIKVNSDDLDDFVLIKSDGFPTYHFAVVVDDHLMKISHVLRGEEWIASTPKHILLYEAFDWHAPIFAHLPQILNKNKKKMSKRDGDVSVKDFISAGYIKEALINFIALLGWNSGTEQEVYSIDEMIKQFSLDNIHKSGAIFDIDKLDWLNGVYIRDLSSEQFAQLCLPVLIENNLIVQKSDKLYNKETKEEITLSWLRQACELEKDRIKKITEISQALKFIFITQPEYEAKILPWKKSDASSAKQILGQLQELLSTIAENDFTTEYLNKTISGFIEKSNLTNGEVMWPWRVALSGSDKSPGPFEIAPVLGKEKTLSRIKYAINLL